MGLWRTHRRDDSHGGGRVGPEVTLGLPAAWALHDAEEPAALPCWSRRDVPRLRQRPTASQVALSGFGLHGLVHLAQAVAVRGCIPGSATSPVVVVPFTLWAHGRPRRAGVPRPARPWDVAVGIGAAAAATVASHMAARRLLGGLSGRAGRAAGRRGWS